MHDAGGVRRLERRANLHRNVQGGGDGNRTLTQTIPQCFSFDELRRKVLHVVLCVELEDGEDVWMIEG